MAAILAQMNRNPIRPAKVRFHGSPNRVRLPGPPRLPQSRNMVDIDAKFNQSLILASFSVRTNPQENAENHSRDKGFN
jgi:hypothetical protein